MSAAGLSWRQVWVEASQVLGSAQEARWICQHASGRDTAEWALGLDDGVGARALAHVDGLVARRRAGEPLQYVLASWPFRTLDLLVDRRVLIPRPETEQVVEEALALVRAVVSSGGRGRPQGRPWLLADLGTGSGAIALSLAAELPLGAAEVWATDVSPDALDVARANLAGLGRPGGQVRLAEGSWWSALPVDLVGRFDLVVSNPPYVGASEELPPSVVDWEPRGALVSGPTGLEAVEEVLVGAARWLAPGGGVVVELGASQGAAAAALAQRAGLVDVEVRPDLAGLDRMVVARRPS